MALVFNPFTGNFDNIMASSSDMSFSGGSLNVNGDITLDSGGTFTTTVQAVTPTANRTVSFPDKTGTVALVSGATGNIQYNDGGSLAGSGDLNVDLNWTDTLVTYTGLKVNVTNTASAGSSRLFNFYAGGVSKVSSTISGQVGAVAGYGLCRDTSIIFSSSNTDPLTSSHLTLRSSPTASQTLVIGNVVDNGIKRDSAGVLAITDGSTGTGYLKQTPVLTNDLPNAATVGAGTRGFVSDAGSTTFNVAIGTGTGTPSAATTIPVFSDGSVWKAG